MKATQKAGPVPKEFPSVQFLYSSSPDGVDTNLLVLLHGLGDQPANFMQFGKKMQLPQTALLAIKGPSPIPFFEGTGWAPAFDQEGNEIPPSDRAVRDGIKKTRGLLATFLEEAILTGQSTSRNRWHAKNVFLLGFSQGGAAAVDLALLNGSVVLGGVVSISGLPSPESYPHQNTLKPNLGLKILVTHGSADETLPKSEWKARAAFVRNLVGTNGELKVHEVAGKGHGMPTTETEMREIMKFFGANLGLRNLALEAMSDVYEVK
ncbi:Alpha/Beta hydrolase protein [Fimicolochytrium jonesii]|uniref:Alpha/Beta hydrolase protein n=1 Tax=Fimicolochytrium jonesii TaxID=1396493 RepID=UPI0022FDF665|nr:Alpha/Beta hydrolase protein [Fimicolochytrium jonesii]KAI8827095.1 Alpha/Beta hydrolase protein [Fimicolochytrium jonesii]